MRLNLDTGKYELDADREPYTGVIVGARADEEGSRSKERYFSPRDKNSDWDVGDQPPEFWNQFKTDFAPGTHVRVHPLLDWTELNIWEYIKRESIPTVSLYYDQGSGTRYRSLGCGPCQAPIKSTVQERRRHHRRDSKRQAQEHRRAFGPAAGRQTRPRGAAPQGLHVTAAGVIKNATVAPGAERETFNVVIVGHVDHGKSTVVGRLLADTGALPQGKLEAVRRECERTGKPFEYAFLLDALSDEQDQGITIDTARCFFKSAKRDYIIIDAPGHIEFLKNMISGAARAEAAVLVIDAKEGVRENSRRHGYILSMLGIKQVVVCVNKMDLVGYNAGRVRRDREGVPRLPRGDRRGQPAPVRARSRRSPGVNLAARGTETPWYKGPTLLELLDGLPKAPPKHRPAAAHAAAGGLQVHQTRRRPAHLRGADRSGARRGRRQGRVFAFEQDLDHQQHRGVQHRARRTAVEAGWSTGFTLTEEIYVTRGEVMSHVERPPLVSTRLRANLIWLGKKPFVRGRDYKLKLGTTAVPVQLHKINKVIDASELNATLDKDHVGRHDVADVVLELQAAGGVRPDRRLRGDRAFRPRRRLRRRRRRHHHRRGRRRAAAICGPRPGPAISTGSRAA